MVIEELTNRLQDIIRNAVDSLGYEVWGIEFSGTERGGLLRIYIDSPSGVSISDCTIVSKHLDVILDIEDPIKGPYTMEVSSPGLDRKFFSIDQLLPYVGQSMRIKLKVPVENRKKWKGSLKGVDLSSQELIFEWEGEEILFNWKDIENIKLIYWDK